MTHNELESLDLEVAKEFLEHEAIALTNHFDDRNLDVGVAMLVIAALLKMAAPRTTDKAKQNLINLIISALEPQDEPKRPV